MVALFWIPLLIGIALLVPGLVLPALNIAAVPEWTTSWLIFLAVACILAAGFLAYRDRTKSNRVAGKGGSAKATGTDSNAIGGRGGNAVRSGVGGAGGEALAKGRRSTARGGDGGST